MTEASSFCVAPAGGLTVSVRWGFCLLFHLLASLSIQPWPLEPAPIKNYHPIKVLRVIDGDTIVANVRLPWGVTLEERIVQCAGYDAWALDKRGASYEVTEEEMVKGKKAKSALHDLLINAEVVYLSPDDNGAFDPYGRILGHVYVRLKTDRKLLEVRVFMKAHKHVRTK